MAPPALQWERLWGMESTVLRANLGALAPLHTPPCQVGCLLSWRIEAGERGGGKEGQLCVKVGSKGRRKRVEREEDKELGFGREGWRWW